MSLGVRTGLELSLRTVSHSIHPQSLCLRSVAANGPVSKRGHSSTVCEGIAGCEAVAAQSGVRACARATRQ